MEQLLKQRIDVAAGRRPADLLFKGGKVVNVFTGELLEADVAVVDCCIAAVGSGYEGVETIDCEGKILAPGFIDAHVHIESSLASPGQFARAVMPRGTTAVIADPHELANVCGTAALEYMLKAGEDLPLDLYVMLPSCVPATAFEHAGAELNAAALAPFIDRERVAGLGEMMNYPGVIAGDPAVLAKLALAYRAGKIIDGHSPQLSGRDLNACAAGGIHTDHECEKVEEMIERLRLGMYVQIREGSAARNLAALLAGVTPENLRRCLFCTDDRHPGDILRHGHIDNNIREAIRLGLDPVAAIRMATLNTAECYGLEARGALAPGYAADIVLLNDLHEVQVERVYKDGEIVAENGKALFTAETEIDSRMLNTVHLGGLEEKLLRLPLKPADGSKNGKVTARVIEIAAGSLVTTAVKREVNVVDGCFQPTAKEDVLKLAVVERHRDNGSVGVGLVSGFGLRGGALASTVGHDSHNLILLGDTDVAMMRAAKEVERIGGGLVVVRGDKVVCTMPLPVAGLISNAPLADLDREQRQVTEAAHTLGIPEQINPFMLLAFLALPVIPELRLTDMGLFDVVKFAPVPVQV
ncbi:MAG: adenine deaminase [Desulforhopalus sp.]|nr:adenine deaminase [Desulforhopalus sp.]